MTDQDRIDELLQEHNAYSKALAGDLLTLVIDIAGERLIEKERTRAEIYEAILTNKMVKPEFYQAVYKLMNQSKERLK